jgi:hypothetical protein
MSEDHVVIKVDDTAHKTRKSKFAVIAERELRCVGHFAVPFATRSLF